MSLDVLDSFDGSVNNEALCYVCDEQGHHENMNFHHKMASLVTKTEKNIYSYYTSANIIVCTYHYNKNKISFFVACSYVEIIAISK